VDQHEPGTAADVAEKRKEQFRRLVKAYKGVFASENGRLVLADLKAAFGFERCEANSEALSDNQIARRVCMKAPIFHIERMRNYDLREKPKPKRALAGSTHHENTDPPNP
jgi:hypothetical protein